MGTRSKLNEFGPTDGKKLEVPGISFFLSFPEKKNAVGITAASLMKVELTGRTGMSGFRQLNLTARPEVIKLPR